MWQQSEYGLRTQTGQQVLETGISYGLVTESGAWESSAQGVGRYERK